MTRQHKDPKKGTSLRHFKDLTRVVDDCTGGIVSSSNDEIGKKIKKRYLINKGSNDSTNLLENGEKKTATVIEVNASAYFREVYSDVLGPMQVEDIYRKRYAIHFTEVFSKFRSIYFMHTKDEAVEKIKEYYEWLLSKGFKLKELRCDNGGEYVSDEVKIYANSKFTLRTTPPHTPEVNGVAERFNRLLVERVRALLKDSNLPKFLWSEAMSTIVYIYNRIPNLEFKGAKSPFEQLFGYTPDISHFKIFGCTAFAYNYDIERRKLDDRAIKGIFVGYEENSASYRIYIPNRRKIMKSGHVIFHEKCQAAPIDISDEAYVDDWKILTEDAVDTTMDIDVNQNAVTDIPENIEESNDEEKEDVVLHKPIRELRKRTADGKVAYSLVLEEDREEHTLKIVATAIHLKNVTSVHENIGDICEPETYEQAIGSPQFESWKEAITDEFKSIYENSVWHKVTHVPDDATILTTKWIFRIKYNHGEIERFKARLCIRGFEQIEGIDYDDIYSPVIRLTSLRTLLSVTAQENDELEQIDIKTAFQYPVLKEELYIYAPEGSGYPEGTILKLDKSMYGLKQAPREFNQLLNQFIVDLGFTPSDVDPCIYTKMRNNHIVRIGVYVDDIVFSGKDGAYLKVLKQIFADRFKIKDFPTVSKVLSIEITRNRANKTLTLSMPYYIDDLLVKFKMSDCGTRKTPLPSNAVIVPTEISTEELEYMKNVPYRECIGKLIYLSSACRPDISYAVSMLASVMQNPSKYHWSLVKYLLQYLKGTKHRGITYRHVKSRALQNILLMYSDADYAGNLSHKKSRTGYLGILNGGPIIWYTKLQLNIALSSTEAEYYALSETVQEALWLRNLLYSINIPQNDATMIFEDNSSTLSLAVNSNYSFRTKHIAVRHHFMRQHITFGDVQILKIDTKEQLADILTKNTGLSIYNYLLSQLMTDI